MMYEPGYVHIIDDDEGLRDSLGSLVRSVGNEARVYGSVAGFLEEARPDVASCMLLDIRLPGTSGLDFQEQLRRSGIFMPVILMTGFGDIEMSVRGMKAGALDFLTKPFRHQDVLHGVNRALAKDRARRQESEELAVFQRLIDTLTPRERQVIDHVITGMMNKHIALELGLSEITVKIHRGAAMRKLGATSLPDLVRMDQALRTASAETKPTPVVNRRAPSP